MLTAAQFAIGGKGKEDWLKGGTTAEEQLEGEPLGDRLSRELPDGGSNVRQDAPEGRLVDPESGVDESDNTSELIATDEATDRGPLSAEEEAMHLEPEE